MRFDKSIKLISATQTNVNGMGNPIEVPSVRNVFGNKKSIRQSEFYQAAVTALRPEITFEVWTCEYNQEEKLEYNSKQYNIIRTFDRNDKVTELICQGIVNQGV